MNQNIQPTTKVIIITGSFKTIEKQVSNKMNDYRDWHVVSVGSSICKTNVVITILVDRFRR